MKRRNIRHIPLVTDRFHPFVYKIIVGLVLWLVLSVWVFFDGNGYLEIICAVVSGLFFMAVAIPYLLWRNSPKGGSPGTASPDAESFRNWMTDDVDTGDGRLKGVSVAVEVILPIAVVAFGMTAFGVVLHLTAIG